MKNDISHSPLNIGLIDSKTKKKGSIFDCCKKILFMHRRTPTPEDYDL
jgi:hypothetical protein